MDIREINNKEEWNAFVSTLEHSVFLQSWEWGEFQEKFGNNIIRFGIYSDKLIAVVQLIRKKLIAGRNYLYAPSAPLFFDIEEKNKQEVMDLFVSKIGDYAKEEKVVFVRMEPDFKFISDKYRVSKTIDIQPPKTVIIDLKGTEEMLLGQMHQKTRYNIRLAEKKGVIVKRSSPEGFDQFWRLMAVTAERDGFRLHTKNYYKRMLEICNKNVYLYSAEYKGKIIAENIASFFGDTAVYIHGASSNEHRNIMAPYLLQWKLILEAREQGIKYYDFYGIDEDKWPGVTRFKKGFGGEVRELPGTYDVIIDDMWYNIYVVLRKIRRKIKI